MENPFRSYINKFSEHRLWEKLRNYARQAGLKTVYSALLLFYAYRRKDTPYWAKNIVLGTLGYFLSPIDAVPDLTPIIGYTDDIGVLAFGLVTIAAYVNQEVKTKAKGQLHRWFGKYDERELEEVDAKI
ncbi:MAG: YkvA family protein [Phaeodactylibacter sp.]|uniref:YkvA family protein n=1 Tax=Phaeodactylibacter sp. TaxID=1940289 RepID=UPI0032ED6E4C